MGFKNLDRHQPKDKTKIHKKYGVFFASFNKYFE